MNIKILSDNLSGIYLMWIKRGETWSNKIQIKKLSDQSTNIFKKIGQGNQWWLLI